MSQEQTQVFDITFTEAERRQAFARIGIFGPSGCGKTMTGLLVCDELQTLLNEANGTKKKFAGIDTEHGAMDLYAPSFKDPDGTTRYRSYPMHAPFSPDHYIQAMKKAEAAKADVLFIDGISHEWFAEGGVQQMVDEAAARNFGGNKWSGWAVGTPAHNRFLETLLALQCHVVVTMRAKTEWGKDDKNKPVKIGLGPVQRDGIEYEFMLTLRQELDHSIVVDKSRMHPLIPVGLEAEMNEERTRSLAKTIHAWLTEGVAAREPAPAETKPAAETAEPAPEPAQTEGAPAAEAEAQPEPAAETADTFPTGSGAEAAEDAATEAGDAPSDEPSASLLDEPQTEKKEERPGLQAIKPATKGAITKAIGALQSKHADYNGGTDWEARLMEKLPAMPWNGRKVTKIGELLESEGQELLKTIAATDTAVTEAKLKAETTGS